MKTYAAVATVLAVFTIGHAAQAQQCYTPVKSWQGNYTLTASGTVSCPGGGATCSADQLAVGEVTANAGAPLCSLHLLQWAFTDMVATATLNDTMVIPCNPGSQTFTLTGSGGGFSPGDILSLDLGGGTYTYEPYPIVNLWTLTSQDCSGGITTQNGVDYALYPINNYPPPAPVVLPASVQALTQSSLPFQSEDAQAAIVPWTLSFTLTPNADCKACQQNESQRMPVSSSISTQTQSLGEDVAVVGTGLHLHYESGRAPGAAADAIAASDASMIGSWTLSVHHAYDLNANTLFLGDGTQRNGDELGTPVSFNGNTLLTSEDATEVYVFSSAGQHLQTLRPLTGAIEYNFAYDSAAKLISVTDATGNVTTIQRNASEQPTAIVSPHGQTTTLALDSNGFLSQVTDPLGKSQSFVNSSTGLLTSRTDSNGNVFNYTYDSNGKLIKDADPLGGYVELTRTDATSGFGWTVGEATSMGRTSSYETTLTLPWIQDGTQQASEQQSVTWPDGLVTTSSQSLNSNQLTESYTLPDGTAGSRTMGPDPRWGLQAPVSLSGTLTLGNLTMTTTGSRTAVLGTPGNPFSLTTQTDTQKVNGRTYTSVFTASTKTYVDETPMKRKTTTVLDSLERISSAQVGTLLPTKFAYDSLGRLSTLTQGTRTTTLAYDSNGFLASATDPLSLTTSFTRDADGRLLTTTLPDGRAINYNYDANGNVTSITPPGKSAHDMAYTAVDLLSSYTPPTVSGTGVSTYAYNADRDPTTITRPDGQTIQFAYDSAGRLSSTTTPTEAIAYSYDTNTGNLTGESISGGEALAYGYNGPLLTSSAVTGTVAGTVSRTYNNNFWVTSESINGGNTVNFTYDNDGLLTKAGSMALKSNPDGLLTGTTLGSATDSLAYDTFGELTGYTAKYGTTVLYSDQFTRDADGRISSKTETIAGKKSTYKYSYDPAGRLTAVKKNGANFSSYTYDSNSNRLAATTSSGTATGTYDAQDRLLAYGNVSYTYTANGELARQTAGSQTTTYTYDVLGNLTAATLPNGTSIGYIVDSEDHRVGKVVNGALAAGFVYDDDRLVAQLNGANQIVSQFVYATGSTSPSFMLNGGVTYRIFSDQLGSPRLVINTSTGVIVEEIDYDEFGNVINDTDPGFQPFGLAGGLYDKDTKLVRFGARDYNPSIGRWTAKDPIIFAGGDTNLYGYVVADPVNLIDPSGLCDERKKKAKKVADKIAHKVTGDAVKVGPLNVSIVKPEVSIGGSVGVEVEGQTVVEATGTVAVGVTDGPAGDPAKPDMFYTTVDGNLKIWHLNIGSFHWEHTFGDPTKSKVAHDNGADDVHKIDKQWDEMCHGGQC